MRKIIALALCLALLLCAAAVQADETEAKTRLGTLKVGEEFTIRSKVPENYIFSLVTSTELNLVGILTGGAGQPIITVSIAYNEDYAGVERFNDVDEATVEEIRESFMDMDEVVFEDLETAYGTRLLKVTQVNRSFADIYTIYKGYELEFVMAAQGEATDADMQMLVDFISSMDFIPVE